MTQHLIWLLTLVFPACKSRFRPLPTNSAGSLGFQDPLG